MIKIFCNKCFRYLEDEEVNKIGLEFIDENRFIKIDLCKNCIKELKNDLNVWE